MQPMEWIREDLQELSETIPDLDRMAAIRRNKQTL